MVIEPTSEWSSTAFPAAHRDEAWEDALKCVYGSWDLQTVSDSDFNARMVHRTAGGLQIVECVCDPCSAIRTHACVANDASETITIQVVLSGRENLSFDDRQVVVEKGDVLLWNSTRPMKFDITEPLHKISVTMPLTRLRSWLPDRWRSIEGTLPHISEGTGLLTSFIGLVTAPYLEGRIANPDALTESVMGLLVNVLDEGTIRPTTLRANQLIAVKDHIERNLGNSKLSIASIAQAKRISIRYLHALFEGEGTTVQRYVYCQRLKRCARELRNPSMCGRTITEIAFAWGFQNATHFSRRFKEEFGVSPSDFRQATIMR